MMNDMISVIQAVIRDQLRCFKTAELGIVTQVYSHESAADKNNYECDVRLRDSNLELKRVPVATQRIGAVAIPNMNDLVLVQFLYGDIHSAIITGRVYNDADRPPEAKPHEFVYISPDTQESGIRRVYLEFPNGNKVLIDDNKIQLETGNTVITFNHDGDVVINSNAKLTIETKGETKISAKGNIQLESTGDISLDGMNVEIKGKTSAKLESATSTTVKGANISIAGMTNFSPG